MSSEVMPAIQQDWTETPPQNPPLRHFIGQFVESQTWLDKLAAPLQNWLLKLYGQPGEPNRKIKDALNGVWLGHALHPALTDIPIGAWSSTMVLDMAWLTNEDKGVAQGSDISLILGIAGAAGAAVTGLTDWSDLDGTDRRVGIMHGLLNSSALLANIGSLVLRLTGKRRAGVCLSTAGYAVSLFAAYLGGELAFAKGIGVNHVAWEGGSNDFVAVMAAQDLVEGKLTRVDAAGIPAVLLKQGNAIYAIGATCTHLAGPLDEGTCQDGVVTCPWHGSRFRMTDGAVMNGPATYAAPTFAVRVRKGQVELRRLDHA
ncbi:MAG TPA: Rieske 2Fe-2S domain-containing protein [Ktedonobacteraceae bacterium]|nr:Rieske 2Fe-2S domain-containing protein [Ktedonobacteraceae bacterium]